MAGYSRRPSLQKSKIAWPRKSSKHEVKPTVGSGCGRSKRRLDGPYQRRMQRAELGDLTMWYGRRHREPLCRVRQIERLFQIELGVVAEARGLVGGWISIAQDRKFTSAQGSRPLAGSVRDAHRETRRIIIEDCQDQGWPRLRARVDVVGKMAPDNLTGGGLGPPLRCHAGSASKRLERTDFFLPCGASLLI